MAVSVSETGTWSQSHGGLVVRQADMIPECFKVESGPFDVGEVEEFLGARRDVLMSAFDKGGGAEPLVPVSRLPGVVRRRWQEYLDRYIEADRPSGLKLARRLVAVKAVEGAGGEFGRPPSLEIVDGMSEADREGFVPGQEPWVGLGISKATYYRRKARGEV